jgi:hypothetical protein
VALIEEASVGQRILRHLGAADGGARAASGARRHGTSRCSRTNRRRPRRSGTPHGHRVIRTGDVWTVRPPSLWINGLCLVIAAALSIINAFPGA